MTTRNASPHMTSCEALRLITDLCQSDSEKDRAVRDLCTLGIVVGKIVSMKVSPDDLRELVAERKQVINCKELLIKRNNPNYKCSWHKVEEIKKEWGIK